MNEFRQALDGYIAGRNDLEAVKQGLDSSLARQPQLAAAHGAYVEALYRSNRISGEVYLALIEVVRALQKLQAAAPSAAAHAAAQLQAATPASAAASLPAGAGATLSAADPDKTRFRAAAQESAPAPQPVTSAPAASAAGASASAGDASAPAADGDKTIFRSAPGTRSAARAEAAPAPEKTRFRVPVPAGADSSWSPTTGTGPHTGTDTGTSRGLNTGSTTGGSTGSGRSTGSSWSDVGRWGGGTTVLLEVGSVIKERFILEEELGRGGMGIVFKARDLRMEEAQDRNPYVAIKILNEEFKRHPESLKALQREFRKAQSLAHPNVVTVGDFDRDGGNVFMTMELLEGEALDRVIKRVRGAGIEKKEALRIARDICRAMAYAHERGVVHSDFKPANAFLTRGGTVKVFDFGIARATRRSENASGTVTLFDASTLGALTPAYASCEMIEGLEPDVRDDVYAIACVVYELLTGNHPFDRKSAAQARDAKLSPARPLGLSRAQWRALQRGLAFQREHRTSSAIELLNGLLPPKRSPTVYVGAGAAALAVVVVSALVLPGQIERYREQRLLDALRGGQAAGIQAVLPALDAMNHDLRDRIFADRDARGGLIGYYDDLIKRAESRGDYWIADQAAKKLLAYLPDYADAQRISDRVTSDRNDEIKRQSDRFDRDLEQGRLIPAQGAENIEAVLAAVRRIDPQHALLHDPRLPSAYAAQARLALQSSDTALAQSLVASGLAVEPNDPTLRDLRDQVRATAAAQERAARVARLERSLSALLAARPALTDLISHRGDMAQLGTDSPSSAVLARVQQYAQGEIARQERDLEQRRAYPDAQALLDRYADLASAAFIESARERLDTARLAYEHKTADEARLKAQRVADLKGSIDTLLRRGPGDDAGAWDAQLRDAQAKLSAYVPPTDAYFAQVRASTAGAYLQKEQQLRQAQRLTEASQMLEQARAYAPQSAQWAQEAQLLEAARTQQAAAAKERARVAQIQALEQKLLDQANANTLNDALTSLAELKANLPANDPFLTRTAPEAIGRSYLRLAVSAALDGRFEQAEGLVARGREAAPSLAPLASAQQRFQRYSQLDREMAGVEPASANRVRGDIDQAARLAPEEADGLRHALARTLIARIRALPDASEAEQLKAVARSLFPNEGLVARAFPAPGTQRAQRATQPPPQAAVSPTVEPPAAKVSAPTARAAAPLVARVTETPRSAPLPAPAAAARPTSQHDCSNPELVGTGGNPRASCWDEVGGGRGPLLVVVPPQPGGPSFAIGRYEVSNADFARYCSATGRCKANTAAPDLPVTSISLQDAEGYLAWLSQQSGATYRLPTAAEWTYAADAGTPGGEHHDANCEKPGISTSLLPVRSGDHNSWGLYNYAGNAQEWVRSGTGVAARGGAYTDSFSQCTPAASRPHTGAPDPVTGFRVLRELK